MRSKAWFYCIYICYKTVYHLSWHSNGILRHLLQLRSFKFKPCRLRSENLSKLALLPKFPRSGRLSLAWRSSRNLVIITGATPNDPIVTINEERVAKAGRSAND